MHYPPPWRARPGLVTLHVIEPETPVVAPMLRAWHLATLDRDVEDLQRNSALALCMLEEEEAGSIFSELFIRKPPVSSDSAELEGAASQHGATVGSPD